MKTVWRISGVLRLWDCQGNENCCPRFDRTRQRALNCSDDLDQLAEMEAFR